MKITGLTKLGLRWKAGQKLVCVNATPPPNQEVMSAPLIEGAVYVVRDTCYTDVVHVIGIDGQLNEHGCEYGHHFSRFVELRGKKEEQL